MPSGAADNLAWWAFRAADQAEPQTSRGQYGRDLCREVFSLSRFVEDMKTTTIEHELEGTAGRRRDKYVPNSEVAADRAALHFGLSSLHRERRHVNSKYIETTFRQPNCVRTGASADV